jgi:predicted nucleic acid-binding protein
MIIIDTDVLIEILDKKSSFGETALKRIRESMEPSFITSITLHEMLYGQMKHSKDLNEVLALPVLSYTKEDAKTSALLEVKAESKGKRVSRTDSMIAAIAINYGAMLYTNNTKDFNCFDGLTLF